MKNLPALSLAAVVLVLALCARRGETHAAESAAPFLHCVSWPEVDVLDYDVRGGCWLPMVSTPTGTKTWECRDLTGEGCALVVETPAGTWQQSIPCGTWGYVVVDPATPDEYLVFCW